jgi:hypothetical protein
MKKLKLNVDTLVVESFRSTDAPEASRGTVQAHEPTFQLGCQNTAELTCAFTCGRVESCQLFC